MAWSFVAVSPPEVTTRVAGDPLPHVSDALLRDALRGRCLIGSRSQGVQPYRVVVESARLRGLIA